MAFRYAGTAWDGQRWAAAPAIMVLGKQVEAIRPGTFAADGTVASKGHDANNPDSDHTVWPKTGSGIVYAIDITETSNFSIDTNFEAIRLARHPALKYAIHHSRMFASYATSSRPAWTWGPYSGYNAHKLHGHISVHHDSRGSLTQPWPLVGTPVPAPEPPPTGGDIVLQITRTTIRKGDKTALGGDVAICQGLLYAWGQGSTVGTVDGIFGTATDTAVKNFQKSKGLTADGIVGAKTWAALES